MNLRFVSRALLLAIPLALLITAGWVLTRLGFTRIADPTPPPPTIVVPQGERPTGVVGLREWAQYRNEPYQPVGCGFFLLLDDDEVVGVTTAHSVSLEDPNRPLERIALGIAGHPEQRWEFTVLRGLPGHPVGADDLSADYLLLDVRVQLPEQLLLEADPRGAPQPGERVHLYSGLGDGHGGPSVHEGTVQSVDGKAFWMLTDRWFNPAQMSGSPIVSQHTGQVVGMVVVGSPRLGRILLGAHPIGSLVRQARSATAFPSLSESSSESR